MNGQGLQGVDKFTYLRSTLSRAVHIDDELTARIANASVAFGRLRGNVWDRSGIRFYTKMKVYKSVVLPTLLYAFDKVIFPESWEKSIICPVHKKGSKDDPDNYRRISLTNIISKIFTILLNSRLSK